jgi:ADP-ribose pyrophosphatase YjhB (NUDIX family)
MTDKGPRIKIIPPGDSRERLSCPECDYVSYDNPKIVNAVVAVYKDQFLLCRRAIEPGKGLWTLPGGYMENGETLQEGASRETREEAGASINVGPLLAIYQTPSKKEVIMIYRAEMTSPDILAGIESLEVKLFKWNDIPWKDLAFPMVEKGLTIYQKTKHLKNFQPEYILGTPSTPKPAAPKFKPPKL